MAPGVTLETELSTWSMGGALHLLVASSPDDGDRAERVLRLVAGRIRAWAERLTRFSATSDLATLNADATRSPVALRPTIASVLSHARGAAAATDATVDVGMLDARIAAETGDWSTAGGRSAWSLAGHGRRKDLVRHGRVRFDLDGVAKGWIADRALRLLDAYPGALVDADGDMAVRTSRSAGWCVAVAHPCDDRVELARLRVPRGWHSDTFGVATSGTSVHRWHGPQGATHHLIDPFTGRPAVTDVVQATVVAQSAGLAEVLAKAAVIRGSRDGSELLRRAGAWAALLVLEHGDPITIKRGSEWFA